MGAGNVARRIHIPAFQQCSGVEIAAVYDPDPAAARASGIPKMCSSPDELLDSGIDAVVVAAPNHHHRNLALAALQAGKHVLCEKPLAMNAEEAAEMLRAAERAGRIHMTAFTYEFTPAVRYLKQLVEQGELGEIRSVRAAYLMALSTHLLGWRSLRKYAGSGVLADIGSHLIHLVEWLAGDITALTARLKDFRKDPSSDVEDWIAFLAELASGAMGTIEISRVCPGRGADITENIWIELYGTAGSAVFSLQDPWGLEVALGEDGRDPGRLLRRVEAPGEFLRIAGSSRDVSVGEKRWSYRFDQAVYFVESIRQGTARCPSFADGWRCQKVLDAALQSAESGAWVKIP
jgi:predicted dehydrogenase